MIKPKAIKYFILVSIVCFASAISCQQQIIPEIISDPAAHNMKIIPPVSTIRDEIKLVIYDDCNYNTLSEITKSGNTIHVVKQFNSLMMRPCMMLNDTINIGKLKQGDYILNYKLLDLAHTPPQITLSLNFNLAVTQY